MNITINEFIISKIRSAKDGEAILTQLIDLTKRDNTEYHRGALHGYLLALTRQNIITGNDAIAILEQLRHS